MRKIFKIILAYIRSNNNYCSCVWSNNTLRRGGLHGYRVQTLTPTGTSIGKAIVIYDPGLSGTAKGVADKIAADLQAKSYTVTLAGVKSSAAAPLQVTISSSLVDQFMQVH